MCCPLTVNRPQKQGDIRSSIKLVGSVNKKNSPDAVIRCSISPDRDRTLAIQRCWLVRPVAVCRPYPALISGKQRSRARPAENHRLAPSKRPRRSSHELRSRRSATATQEKTTPPTVKICPPTPHRTPSPQQTTARTRLGNPADGTNRPATAAKRSVDEQNHRNHAAANPTNAQNRPTHRAFPPPPPKKRPRERGLCSAFLGPDQPAEVGSFRRPPFSKRADRSRRRPSRPWLRPDTLSSA